MANETEPVRGEDRIAVRLRQYEVERFHYDRAALLDSHRYEEWLSHFSEDARYFMPIRRTRTQRELDKEFPRPGEMAFFDDTKQLLAGRIAKLKSGKTATLGVFQTPEEGVGVQAPLAGFKEAYEQLP